MKARFIILSISLLFFLNSINASNIGLIENSSWQNYFIQDTSDNGAAYGDIDNDGDMDFISISVSDKPYVWINNGTSLVNNTNWEQNLSDSGSGSLTLGDIDNDGYLDLVISGAINPWTQIYINNGTRFNANASWQKYVTGEDGAASTSVALGDIDNDGDLDLIFPGMTPSKMIYLNNGTTFINSILWGQNIIGNTYKFSTGLVDLNNDGYLDLGILGMSSEFYINNKTSFIYGSNWYPASSDEANVGWGDLNNDGYIDYSISQGISGVEFALNNGSYCWRNDSWNYDLSALFWGSMMFGDYGNNGYLDLVHSGGLGGGWQIEIASNNGTSFTVDATAEANLTGPIRSSILWGDIDNDLDLDLISIGNWKVYISNASLTNPNEAPTPPTSFSSYYNNREIKLGWSNGSDNETISTGLYYNLKLGTAVNNHSIISGVYGGGGDAVHGGTAFGYFGNMMQRKNFTLKVDRLSPSMTYYWSVQTIDTGLKAGNWSVVQSFTTLADMTRPDITLNSPVAYFNSSSHTITVNATVFDNMNLTNVSLWGNWTGSWHLNQTNYSGINNTDYIFTVNLTGYSDGSYTWMIRAEDNETNVQNSSIRTFSIDTTNPGINITYPINNTNYTSNTLNVNYTYTETNPDSCWWTNNSGSSNNTINCGTNITTQTWNQGTNQIIIYINDTVNHVNSTSVNFTIDSINPNINITYPSNFSNSTDNTIDINYTASDTNLQSCWYTNDTNSVNTTLASCGTNITTINWSEGQHNVTVWTNDTFGNINSSLVFFIIDTEYPIINLISPANASTWTSSSTVTFSYNVTDVAIANCSLIIDNSVDQTDTSITENTTQTFTKTMDNGTYYWNINCTDYVGYTNTSETRNLTVDYTTEDGNGESPGGGGGGTITTFWSNTYVVSDENFVEGFERELTNKQRVKVSVGGESHYVGIVSLTSLTATINISTDPVQVILAIGDDAKVDVLNDSWYDIYIKLNDIVDNRANLTIKSIHEEIPEGAGTVKTSGEIAGEEVTEKGEEPEEIEERNLIWLWIIIGVVVVGLILIGIKFLRRHKKYRKWKRLTLLG